MKILVVIDMQNDFLTGVLGNAECAATIPAVADVIQNGAYDHIYLTRDTHQDNYMETQESFRYRIVFRIRMGGKSIPMSWMRF